MSTAGTPFKTARTTPATVKTAKSAKRGRFAETETPSKAKESPPKSAKKVKEAIDDMDVEEVAVKKDVKATASAKKGGLRQQLAAQAANRKDASDSSDSDASEDEQPIKQKAPQKTPNSKFKTPAKPTPSNLLEKLGAFSVLPITMPSLPLVPFPSTPKQPIGATSTIPITQNIYFRPHEARKEDGFPKGRTLFVAGLPADSTESHLANLFSECGTIERVVWGDIPKSRYAVDEDEESLLPLLPIPSLPHQAGSTAHVVFANAEGLKTAMELRKGDRKWVGSGDGLVGLEKYRALSRHSHPDQATLKADVESWIDGYETAEKSARLEALSQRNLTDEDGFTLVTRARKGRNTTTGAGATVQSFRKSDGLTLKPKKKELQDFYRFQIREKKVGELAELRRKWEEDKKKVARLKEGRKFRPY